VTYFTLWQAWRQQVGRGRLEPPTGVPSIKKEEKRGGKERKEGLEEQEEEGK
jgi:hypothetical protein